MEKTQAHQVPYGCMFARMRFNWYLFVAGACVAYSEQACRDAAVALGLSLEGTTSAGFSGDFTHKGCYAYSAGKNKGKAFYGTGGTVNDMKKQLPEDRYRPQNYDCAAGNYVYEYYVYM